MPKNQWVVELHSRDRTDRLSSAGIGWRVLNHPRFCSPLAKMRVIYADYEINCRFLWAFISALARPQQF